MSSCPKLRIEGFTDAWEQRKLSNIVDVCSGRDYKHLNDGDIPVYGTGGYMLSVSEALSEKDDAIGIGRKGTIDNPFILRAPFWTVDTLFYCVPKDNYDLNFTYCVFQNINWKSKDESTGVPSLSKTTINNIEVMTPTPAEQKKIGDYFTALDNLITLHQRKSDALKNAKKYFLKNMFPSEGEKFPKLRLEGFTDAWEQRKVTELGEIYIGLVTTMTSHYTDHGTLLIRNSDIKDAKFEFGDNPIYLDDEFAKKNASRKHRVGDVITVHTGDIGTSAVITEKEAGSIGFATIVTRPNTSVVTSDFLCTYLNTDNHKNFAMNISTGDGRNNYNLKDYYECVVPVPPNINEQIKISSFIGRINNLITLHQRKCDALKNAKKFFLQNMFV